MWYNVFFFPSLCTSFGMILDISSVKLLSYEKHPKNQINLCVFFFQVIDFFFLNKIQMSNNYKIHMSNRIIFIDFFFKKLYLFMRKFLEREERREGLRENEEEA